MNAAQCLLVFSIEFMLERVEAALSSCYDERSNSYLSKSIIVFLLFHVKGRRFKYDADQQGVMDCCYLKALLFYLIVFGLGYLCIKWALKSFISKFRKTHS